MVYPFKEDDAVVQRKILHFLLQVGGGYLIDEMEDEIDGHKLYEYENVIGFLEKHNIIQRLKDVTLPANTPNTIPKRQYCFEVTDSFLDKLLSNVHIQ